MKKYLSSLLLIVIFSAYATYRRMAELVVPADPPSRPTQTASDAPPTVPKRQVRNPSIKKPPRGRFRDGIFVGQSADAYYGNVQVQISVQYGTIVDVQLLDNPKNTDTSIRINRRAIPLLAQEAISQQDAPVHVVSGATETSQAFNESLAAAIAQAKN